MITRFAWMTAFSVFATGLLSPVSGAGFVSDQNFVVVVSPQPSQHAAQEIAANLSAHANRYRHQIATDWLNDSLPDGIGRTVIHVEIATGGDVGLTWAKDDPRRAFHNVYLKTTRDRALGSTLAHELVHVVLATEYPVPNRLAPWVEEGIASRYDDSDRAEARAKVLRWIVRTGNWPDVNAILLSRSISTDDQTAYTVAASLTELLVERKGRKTFVTFASDARQLGWDVALRQHYRIDGVFQLNDLWRQAVSHEYQPTGERLALKDR